MAHNGGRMAVNAGPPEYYADIFALDLCKQGYPFDARDAGNAVVVEDWLLYFDANGYPTQMPGGTATKWYKPQVQWWGDVGESWDLVYPSQHTVTFGDASATGTFTKTTVSAGHDRYTLTSSSAPTTRHIGAIQITAMSGSSWTGGIKFYKNTTTNQTDVTAGETFNSSFLSRYGYSSNRIGTIRFMDWGKTNDNFARTLATYVNTNSTSWIRPNTDSNVTKYSGTVTKSGNAYTTSRQVPGAPGSWTDGQLITFWLSQKLTFLTVSSITKGATTTLGITGHGLANGDIIHFSMAYNSYGTGWQNALEEPSLTTGLCPSFVVTVVDANNITIPLNSSSGFGTLSSAYVYKKMTITDGTLPAKLCISQHLMNFHSSDLQAASNTLITGVYHSELDAVIVSGDMIQTGVPIAAMCLLANKLKANPWICLPPLLNATAMQAFIQVVYDNLDSDLTPIFEIGNEPWNFSFRIWRQLNTLSALHFGERNAGYGYAYIANQLATAANAVFTTVKPYRLAWGVWNVNAGGTSPQFECTPISSGVPANYPINRFDIIAPAPYYLPAFTYSATASAYTGYQSAINSWLAGDTATAFAWVATELKGPAGGTPGQQQIDIHLSTYLPAWIAHTVTYPGRNGLTVECYEGGLHFIGPDYVDDGFPTGGITVQNVRDFWWAYLESEVHAGVMQYYLEKLHQLGVKPMQFYMTDAWENDRVWGAQRLNDMSGSNAQTPQHAALMRWNAGILRLTLTTS